MNNDYTKQFTNELFKAVETVCMYCPYIAPDGLDGTEPVAKAIEGMELWDAGEKYCEHCMVRLMCNLYRAEDELQDYLPASAPEWQAIINY